MPPFSKKNEGSLSVGRGPHDPRPMPLLLVAVATSVVGATIDRFMRERGDEVASER